MAGAQDYQTEMPPSPTGAQDAATDQPMSYEQMLQLINPPSPGAGVAPPSEIERSALARVLDDHEIAAVWHAAPPQGRPPAPLRQFLMLTALPRNQAPEIPPSEVV